MPTIIDNSEQIRRERERASVLEETARQFLGYKLKEIAGYDEHRGDFSIYLVGGRERLLVKMNPVGALYKGKIRVLSETEFDIAFKLANEYEKLEGGRGWAVEKDYVSPEAGTPIPSGLPVKKGSH